MSTSLPATEPEILEEPHVRAQCLWCTVVHDDPMSMMNYVTWVFHSYFGLSLPVVETRMMQVYTTGCVAAFQGARERMEVDVTAMHGYGPCAIIEPAGDDVGAGDSSGGR